MKIDLIIDGEVYLAEPYLGQEECRDCGLNEICDNISVQPCRIYPSKVIFKKSLSVNNPKVFAKEYTLEQTMFLSSSIFESDLPTMAKNALYSAEIKTFYDVLNETPTDIMRLRHVGRKSLYKIYQIFEEHNIVWAKSNNDIMQ